MLGAIAAYLLNYKPWTSNDDLLMTMTEWQGGPQKSWIPLYKPVTAVYEDYSVGNEIVLFMMALGIAFWGYRNRHHKVDRIFARGVFGLATASALYLLLTWLARHHVEGDWTAAPPRLMKYEVDTPEYLAKQEAWNAETEAYMLKMGWGSAEERQKRVDRMFGKCMSFIFLFVGGVLIANAA